MAKKDNECPFCGEYTLEPLDKVGHGWLKCSSCGYTHLPNPTRQGVETMVVEQVSENSRETKYRPRKKQLSRT